MYQMKTESSENLYVEMCVFLNVLITTKFHLFFDVMKPTWQAALCARTCNVLVQFLTLVRAIFINHPLCRHTYCQMATLLWSKQNTFICVLF